MKLQTEVLVTKSKFEINHRHKIISIGSCFSEHVGDKFKTSKFNILLNPFGQLYNPVSIANSIDLALEGKVYEESDLFFHLGRWHSFDHHSDYSDTNKETVLSRINNEIQALKSFIIDMDVMFITFGTSFYFHNIDLGKDVANCHKLPNKEFEQKMISVEAVTNRFNLLLSKLSELNPKAKFVFTVSPIRYFTFGNFENNVSKSVLFLAIEDLLKKNLNTSYFPSFEIIMDELRDYRFYNHDMIHPNQTAIDYVWERIGNTYFSNETLVMIKEIKQIVKDANHRPFNPNSYDHSVFKVKAIDKLNSLLDRHPFLNFDEEIAKLKT
jgi:hypothetical protein